VKNKLKKPAYVFVVIRDGVVFDGQFDTEKEAKAKQDYCNQNYRGIWKYHAVKENDFKKFMNSGHFKPLDDLQLARAVRSLVK
jgi:hypothetical protein